MTRFVIVDRVDKQALTEAQLQIEDGGTQIALFTNEFDAQDTAAEYEYECIAQQRMPEDIVIAEIDARGNPVQLIEVL